MSNAQGDLLDPKTKTVLIVDDDEAILNLLEILVQRDGFKVLRAESAEAAVFKLRRKPDAVLLDLILPGTKTGVDVLRMMREGGDPMPVVIVITAHDAKHPAFMEAKKDPNVSHFLSKPINQDELLVLLHRLLKTQPPKGSAADVA
ncbi:MAG: response regulator [Elusimicrobiota bacterium]